MKKAKTAISDAGRTVSSAAIIAVVALAVALFALVMGIAR
jgi:hypothetical protein